MSGVDQVGSVREFGQQLIVIATLSSRTTSGLLAMYVISLTEKEGSLNWVREIGGNSFTSGALLTLSNDGTLIAMGATATPESGNTDTIMEKMDVLQGGA